MTFLCLIFGHRWRHMSWDYDECIRCHMMRRVKRGDWDDRRDYDPGDSGQVHRMEHQARLP